MNIDLDVFRSRLPASLLARMELQIAALREKDGALILHSPSSAFASRLAAISAGMLMPSSLATIRKAFRTTEATWDRIEKPPYSQERVMPR